MTDFIGTSGNDNQNGTIDNDTFDYTQGGDDTLNGRDGSDVFFMGTELTAADRINGGVGFDSVVLDGDYDFVFGHDTMAHVEHLVLNAGHTYTLKLAAASFAHGTTLTVDGSQLGAADVLTVHGTHDRNAALIVHGGQAGDDIWSEGGHDTVDGGNGADTIHGGARSDLLWGDSGNDAMYGGRGSDDVEGLGDKDTLFGGRGNDQVSGGFSDDLVMGNNGNDRLFGSLGTDTLVGGKGADQFYGGADHDVMAGGRRADTFVFGLVNESAGHKCDWITDFHTRDDVIQTATAVSGIDAIIDSGSLSSATFTNDIETAVDAAHLAAQHAVLFAPDTGDLAGHVYLVVDANGDAGLQVRDDYLIEVTGGTGLLEGHLTLDNFG